MKLTEAKVKNAKPRDRRLKIADGGGLYLLVTPEGGKLWRWKYRFEGKERPWHSGRYPEVTLAESSRNLHADARKLLRSGVDPMAQRKAEKMAIRTPPARPLRPSRWRGMSMEGRQKPDYAEGRNAAADPRHPSDRLAAYPWSRSMHAKIVATIKKIEDRGAREIASRALGNVSQVFRYRYRARTGDAQPCGRHQAERLSEGRTRRSTTHGSRRQELPKLLRKIEIYQGSP